VARRTSDDGGRTVSRENQGTNSRERLTAVLTEEIKDRQRREEKGEKALPNGEKREDGKRNEKERAAAVGTKGGDERERKREKQIEREREREREREKGGEKLRGDRVGAAIAGSCW